MARDTQSQKLAELFNDWRILLTMIIVTEISGKAAMRMVEFLLRWFASADELIKEGKRITSFPAKHFLG